MDGERLAKRLPQVATETGIAASERAERLQALQEQLTALRYDEEACDLRRHRER